MTLATHCTLKSFIHVPFYIREYSHQIPGSTFHSLIFRRGIPASFKVFLVACWSAFGIDKLLYTTVKGNLSSPVASRIASLIGAILSLQYLQGML